MPMFNNAQNVDAPQASFTDVGRDLVFGQVVYNTNSAAPDLLAQLNPVDEAVYDHSNKALSGCMPGTRQEVIWKIVEWVNGYNDRPICWLHGAAGCGKSAISKTVAELCDESNRLAASFFFLRGAGRQSRITNLVSTLAHHLAFSVPATRKRIESVLQTTRNPNITHRLLETQFRKLIVEPIQSVAVVTPMLPVVMVVDALDECDDKVMIADFIDVVARLLWDHHLPLRFLFTSRVEEHIREKFSASPGLAATFHLALHDFNADSDLHAFFQSRFSTIYEQKRRLMKNVPHPWPSAQVLQELVRKSSGSFAFAFTLVNFVNDGSDLPHRKLEAALKTHNGLDALYVDVLRSVPRSERFIHIFETVMTVKEQLSIAVVAYLLHTESADVVHALLGVQSILSVPEDDNSPIRLFHTSLRDFLTTKARSNHFYIQPSIRHLSIASDCLAAMVVSAGDDFSDYGGLKFASRYWSYHLLCAIQEKDHNDAPCSLDDFMRKLTDFASQVFDFWVNSIIFKIIMPEILETLASIQSALKAQLNQWPPYLELIIGHVKAFAQHDERSFKKANDLVGYAGYEREIIIREGEIIRSKLVALIQKWRESYPKTTWARFQEQGCM